MSQQIKATAIKMKVDPTKDGDALKFGIEFKVDEPTDGGPDKVWVNLTSKGGGQAIASETLHRLGWNGDLENPTFANPTHTLYSTEREWKGTMQVQWNVSKGEKSRAAIDPDLKQKFLTNFRAQFGDPTPVAKVPTPPKPPVPTPKKAWTMDTAYAAFTDKSGGTQNQKDADWQRLIVKRSGEVGREWDKFNNDDWQSIVDAAIPI